MSTDKTVKIIFKLEQNEDGFPPIAFEMLNASPLESEYFRIENAPFFIEDISYHDIVSARKDEVTGKYHFLSVIEPSRFTCVSIIILDKSMDTFLMDLLRGMKCVIEYGEFGVYRVLGVAIPESINYSDLKTQLEQLESRDLISFSELALSQP